MVTLTTGKQINPDLFKEELAAAGLAGVSHRVLAIGGLRRVEVDTGAENAPVVQAVIDAHDHTRLATRQTRWAETDAIRQGAEDEARTVPEVVGWTPDEASQWMDANVTDVASTRLALKKLAQMVAALNAKVYPALRAEVRRPENGG